MAQYQIMYWQEFPSQVKVTDENGTVRKMLPDYFQQAIDGAAMAEGSTDSDAYLDGWDWGPQEEREGSAEDVAEALVAELEEAYPKSRLAEMVRGRNKS
ncbi:MAG TPA: virulence factor [Candidatus Sulfomarinibacteraceae bacterium]|nr:virulence factor [Candidatus Sulfomarinibacteraceae bacterium]